MVFHRGSCPKTTFYYKGNEIEQCNNFTYLGVVLTTQLSSWPHVQHIISKCNQRIGFLFAKLPLKEIPMGVVLDIFNTYVLPIALYALPFWLPKATEEAKRRLNSVFTKFLKRYLGVPYATHNALVHFVSATEPLCSTLEPKVTKVFYKIAYPSCMSGVRLEVPDLPSTAYIAVEHVPSYIWFAPVLNLPLPCEPEVRRAILYDAFDLHHRKMCDEASHHNPSILCVCRLCGYAAERYHFRRCPAVMFKSPCGRLKFLATRACDEN
jgi:hypothetical protein